METIRVICFEEPITGTNPPLLIWVAQTLEIDLAAQGSLGDTPLEVSTSSLADMLRAKATISVDRKIIPDPSIPSEYYIMWDEGKPLGKHEITDLGMLLDIRTWFGNITNP